MKTTTAFALSVVLFASSSAAAQGAGAPCDKGCLLSTADAYLAAIVAHDASKAPLAPNAKFSEQTKVLTGGAEGLWKSAISVSPTFKISVSDPVSQQIYDDTIHEIEAMGFTLPLYSKNGWSPFVK
jgi:hypothetical protein